MRQTTGCNSIVQNILYKNICTKATAWGKNNEDRAKGVFERKYPNLKILDCGIFINSQWPFLGASPDAIISNDSLLEIKCPYSARNTTIKEAVESRLIVYLKSSGDGFELNKNHNYFYQVQGQLNIWEKATCYFVVWTLHDFVCLKVHKDESFFKNIMLKKLEMFYYNCLLPEIIDPRHPRSMKIRDPQYILDAQEKCAERKNSQEGKRKIQTSKPDHKIKKQKVLENPKKQ